MKNLARATVILSILSMAGCETLDKLGWTTIASTGIGCAAGLGLGAIYDETQRKKANKDRKNDVFAIFKKKKAQNNGKMVGLAVGCLAGLGTGMYLDLMHDDMEEQLGSRGVRLEKVKARTVKRRSCWLKWTEISASIPALPLCAGSRVPMWIR